MSPAVQEPTEIPTLAGTMADAARRGFTEQFKLADGGLRVLGDDATFAADEVVVAEYYRFEGVSDPDDMSILYAIETCDGVRGTLADAYGVYADPLVTAFMDDVALCRGGAQGVWRSAA